MSLDRTPELRSPELLSVGRLAAATGISADTLRIWERRYGKPKPERLPSGHRRYPASMVPWLRKVSEGLARGRRPSQLLALSPEELDALLVEGEPAEVPAPVRTWISHVALSRTELLERAMLEVAGTESVIGFFDSYLTPFLREIGSLWAAGSLEVRHEHLATEVVRDVLQTIRTRLTELRSDPPRGTMLLANLPLEQHVIGLQMVATLCAEQGVQPCLLGANTPLSEIALCAREIEADAVAIGVSLANAGVAADRLLAELRAALPPDLPLVVGGQGSRSGRRGPRGVRVFVSLRDFRKWIRDELFRRDDSR